MVSKEHFTVVIRGGTESPNVISGNETEAKFFINWSTVIPKKYQKFTLYSYFRSSPMSTADTTPDNMVYVECSAFQKRGFFDSKTNTPSSLICVAPLAQTYTTSDYTLFHHESKSIPITVSYPHQDMFDVKLTDISGAVLEANDFTNWTLVLDLVPLE